MEIYKVGGAVRDSLLGRTPQDIDYVVVGSTPEEMISLGYVQVGASFPVFLKDGEEYALARTERKTGVGYNGFAVEYNPDVTLADDLVRRDLTINSMAMTLDHTTIHDPYGGMKDLHDKVLRHTSEAFADDPVRVLRTCRFVARYSDFRIHPDTRHLMKKIVHEIVHVPMERIWTEIQKGLGEDRYQRMFHNLHDVGAFRLDILDCFNQYAKWNDLLNDDRPKSSIEKFAIVSSGFTDEDYTRLTVPVQYSRFSKLFNHNYLRLKRFNYLCPVEKIKLLEDIRVFNEWDLAKSLLWLAVGDSILYGTIVVAAEKARLVDSAAIASKFTSGQDIKQAIFTARVESVTKINTSKPT